MWAQAHLTESKPNELLGSIRQDPLSAHTKARARSAIEASCPIAGIICALYAGLEVVVAAYCVALRDGKLSAKNGDFYAALGMRRYLRTCQRSERLLLAFLEEDRDSFELLGRLTCWQELPLAA